MSPVPDGPGPGHAISMLVIGRIWFYSSVWARWSVKGSFVFSSGWDKSGLSSLVTGVRYDTKSAEFLIADSLQLVERASEFAVKCAGWDKSAASMRHEQFIKRENCFQTNSSCELIGLAGLLNYRLLLHCCLYTRNKRVTCTFPTQSNFVLGWAWIAQHRSRWFWSVAARKATSQRNILSFVARKYKKM